jgi:hypothetical protein
MVVEVGYKNYSLLELILDAWKNEDGSVFLSNDMCHKLTHANKGNVSRCRDNLKSMGIIRYELGKYRSDGNSEATVYWIDYDALADICLSGMSKIDTLFKRATKKVKEFICAENSLGLKSCAENGLAKNDENAKNQKAELKTAYNIINNNIYKNTTTKQQRIVRKTMLSFLSSSSFFEKGSRDNKPTKEQGYTQTDNALLTDNKKLTLIANDPIKENNQVIIDESALIVPEELKKHGATVRNITKQLKRVDDLDLTTQEIQETMDYLAFDIGVNKKSIKSPLAYLMSILKRSLSYLRPKNYRSEEEILTLREKEFLKSIEKIDYNKRKEITKIDDEQGQVDRLYNHFLIKIWPSIMCDALAVAA